ncbi:nucleotidyltransferase family protein [Microvirga sp. 2TAF3]|uniref:nucleotidyltransferase family protein n=1 Tax=Microvirga sp. 2TAF3 TaxID=3233014 RepID=UPI003F96BFAC
MRDLSDIAHFLETQADLRGFLASVESLGLPDCWIGAGFVRNAIWDALHGRSFDTGSLNDVDVVYCDSADSSRERDIALERQLRELHPGPPWSVKNQARMHRRNGDAPYRDTRDAIAHWPETATAIAARSVNGRVEIIAPHGVEDLLNLIVRPTPVFRSKIGIYRQRAAGKDWPVRWPRLTIAED